MNRESFMAEPSHKSWRFERKISLSVCLSALGSLAAAVFLAAALSARVEHLESRAKVMDAESEQMRSVIVGVARLEERLDAVHRALENLRLDMRGAERQSMAGRVHAKP
jgi:hypothetical protein